MGYEACESQKMTDKPSEQPITENSIVNIKMDSAPKGKLKAVGGGDRDQWNERLSTLVTKALPVNQQNAEAISHAGSAVAAGVMDMNPADPIEGVLISQIVVVNEAAMNLYRLGWANSAEHFEASTKYLQLADRASRTVAMLTERLDHHRNQGKQQIVVQHTTTVNANQAVVTDSVVTGAPAGNAAPLAALLTDAIERPMPTEITDTGLGRRKLSSSGNSSSR
jgi:hypothetical protein